MGRMKWQNALQSEHKWLPVLCMRAAQASAELRAPQDFEVAVICGKYVTWIFPPRMFNLETGLNLH